MVERSNETGRPGMLESWTGLIRRRWRAGTAVFAIVLALGAFVTLRATPVYRADARLRLGEPPPMSGVSPTAGFFGLLRLGGDPFANDLQILSSRTLTEQIVADASLNVNHSAPRGWFRDSLFLRFTADRSTDKATYEVEWRTEGDVAVRMISPEESVVGTVAPGATIEFGGVQLSPRPWRPDMPRRITVSTAPFDLAVLSQGPRIGLERVRREANVVDITFASPDPWLARSVVDAVVRRFIALRTTIERRESDETVDSLRVVAAKTQQELTDAENALQAFQERTRLVAPDAQSQAFVNRYTTAVTDLQKARLELDAINSILERMAAAPDSVGAWTTLLTHPRFLENETVGQLLQRLTELEEQRSELASRRAPTSREALVLDEQLEYLNRTLRDLAVSYRTGLGELLVELQAQVNAMEGTLTGLPRASIELGRRQRAVRLLSEIIVLTEQRLRQEELREALTFSNVQIIDPAAIRYKPIWPRRKVAAIVGFLAATMFGLLAVVVVEKADRAVRRADDVRAAADLPVLAAGIRRRGHTIAFDEDDARAVRMAAGEDGRLAFVPVDARVDAARVIAALAAAGTAGSRNGEAVLAAAAGWKGSGTIASYANATAHAAGRVVLLAACGRTRREDLARAAALLASAGATAVGVVLVCNRARDAVDIWK